MIDLERIHNTAKGGWKAARQGRKDLLGLIEFSIPFWLVIIAAGLFILSAPHTWDIFNRLIPWAGFVAPLVIEFGLLFTALRRKYDKSRGDPTSVWFVGLEGLLFISSIIVNGAGSFVWVAASAGIHDMPIGEIYARFGTLPALSQVSLILVMFSAFMIPIGTVVAGEGVAALIFERNHGDQKTEAEWREVAFEKMYPLVFQELLQEGMKPVRAQQRARTLTSGFLSSASGQPASTGVNQPQPTATDVTQESEMTFEEAQHRCAGHPDWLELSDRKLAQKIGCTQYMARKVKLSVFPSPQSDDVAQTGRSTHEEL